MWSTSIWLALAAGIFAWNHFGKNPFIGVRFTEPLVGFPVNGGWLCLTVALYCLVRYFVRRRRERQNPAPRDG